MLPNFLIIGAMKAGTTSLYEYLRAHPQVFVSDKKELDFFVSDISLRHRAWYEGQFDMATSAMAIGEASTAYTKYPLFEGVPRRIAEVIPDARLVYLIRHPIERMRSQYLHELLLGEERRPIEEALLSDSRYRCLSSYALQIAQYLECFARDQLLVVLAEDLRDNRKAVLRRILSFIGVSPELETASVEHEFHKTGQKRVLPPPLRRVTQSSMYRLASPYVPSSVKRFVRRRIMRGVDVRKGEISDRLERELIDRVADDVGRLRGYLGHDFHCWGIV